MSTHRRVKKLAATGGTVATKEEAERGLDSREPLHRRRAERATIIRTVGPRASRGVWGEKSRAHESLDVRSIHARVISLPTTPAAGRRPTVQDVSTEFDLCASQRSPRLCGEGSSRKPSQPSQRPARGRTRLLADRNLDLCEHAIEISRGERLRQ